MTADHIIEKIRGENAAIAADRDAWIEAANAQMKRARAAEAERDALRKALAPFAERCKEAVREDDSDNDGVTVKTIHLRRARTLAGDNHE